MISISTRVSVSVSALPSVLARSDDFDAVSTKEEMECKLATDRSRAPRITAKEGIQNA